MKEDILVVVEESQLKVKVMGAPKSSFIYLIPKDKDRLNLNHFKPISPCNTVYKVKTYNIFSDRLKEIYLYLI